MEGVVKHWTRSFPTSLIPWFGALRCWDAPEGPRVGLLMQDHPVTVSGARGTLFRVNSEVKPEDGHQNEIEFL